MLLPGTIEIHVELIDNTLINVAILFFIATGVVAALKYFKRILF